MRVAALSMGLATVLLCGCAAAAQSSPAARPVEEDCSFRSAATCWTLASRFPPRPDETGGSEPGEILEPAPSELASGADSAGTPAAD